MSKGQPHRGFALLVRLAILVSPFDAGASANAEAPASPKPSADKLILFASDGLRPDLVEKKGDVFGEPMAKPAV